MPTQPKGRKPGKRTKSTVKTNAYGDPKRKVTLEFEVVEPPEPESTITKAEFEATLAKVSRPTRPKR